MASPDRPVGAASGFWVRHSQILAAIFIVTAAALDLGPESWMEWVMWGTTVVSVSTARIVLALIAVILAIALLWPFIRPSRPKP
jgi:hypothetical protein